MKINIVDFVPVYIVGIGEREKTRNKNFVPFRVLLILPFFCVFGLRYTSYLKFRFYGLKLTLVLVHYSSNYTVTGKSIDFTLEQPLQVVVLACPASRILKRLKHKT
jgi:hypothetical protein